jgi:hypothetical protein
MNRIGHTVNQGFHLGVYRMEVVGRTHNNAISVKNFFVENLKIVLMDTFPSFIANTAGVTVFHLQSAKIKQFNGSTLRARTIKNGFNQFFCLTRRSSGTGINADDFHVFNLLGIYICYTNLIAVFMTASTAVVKGCFMPASKKLFREAH